MSKTTETDWVFIRLLKEKVEREGIFENPEYQDYLKAAFEAEKKGLCPQFKSNLEKTVTDIQTGCQKLPTLWQQPDAPWKDVIKTIIKGCSDLLYKARQLMQKKGWRWDKKEKAKLNQRLHNISYIHDYLESSGISKASPELRPFFWERLSHYLEKLFTETEHVAAWISQQIEQHQQRFHRLPFIFF